MRKKRPAPGSGFTSMGIIFLNICRPYDGPARIWRDSVGLRTNDPVCNFLHLDSAGEGSETECHRLGIVLSPLAERGLLGSDKPFSRKTNREITP